MLPLTVAIVDYGMGNLFSVQQACKHVGLNGVITSSVEQILTADGIILPGVGAFGDAMKTLKKFGLAEVLKKLVTEGKPLVGICLGLQLLMSESYEFGLHKGLGIIEGSVVRFENPVDVIGEQQLTRVLKVPQIGWNAIYANSKDRWEASPLVEIEEGENMYFVHSFYVVPEQDSVILSKSRYGNIEFCSSIYRENVFACQFHPERSGKQGLLIYQNIARLFRDFARD